jgi:hypothetical protein
MKASPQDPIKRRNLLEATSYVNNYHKEGKSKDFIDGVITTLYDHCIIDWDIYSKLTLETIPELFKKGDD